MYFPHYKIHSSKTDELFTYLFESRVTKRVGGIEREKAKARTRPPHTHTHRIFHSLIHSPKLRLGQAEARSQE